MYISIGFDTSRLHTSVTMRVNRSSARRVVIGSDRHPGKRAGRRTINQEVAFREDPEIGFSSSHTMNTKRLSYLLTALRVVSASPFLEVIDKKKKHKTGHPGVERGSPEFWYHVSVSALLVIIGGVFAGLTLGLMGLDELHLRVLATSSESKKERQDAHRVLRLLQRGKHWVLVVLLLGNLGGGFLAIVISTTAIVIFGIIPQSLSVHYGLAIGARCTPLVLTLMYVLAPVAWPIAKLLDWILGENEQHTYKKAELKSFLQFHQAGEEPLRDDEITILNGVLELNTKGVESIMTPMKDVVVLSADDILDYGAVHAISQSGYSRIPVHEPGNRDNFIGLLLVKMLLTYDPKKALPVSSPRCCNTGRYY
ncbi:hypothetical protein BJ165DRAFT_265889 [Panaeolus papilionaceus]|nr:hypothetical protein BJ165DRAFT_265889 [Panaeolus papilionaceus]